MIKNEIKMKELIFIAIFVLIACKVVALQDTHTIMSFITIFIVDIGLAFFVIFVMRMEN